MKSTEVALIRGDLFVFFNSAVQRLNSSICRYLNHLLHAMNICWIIAFLACLSISTHFQCEGYETNEDNQGDQAGSCSWVSYNVLDNINMVSVKETPKASFSNLTYFAWPPGKTRPVLIFKICDFVSIKSISFTTSNVKSTGIFVDRSSYFGSVSKEQTVVVDVWEGVYAIKVGWTVKITITPLVYSLPVVISDLVINHCGYQDDCFTDCASYIVASMSGCYTPVCSTDPCEALGCTEDQDCKLILTNDTQYFPALVTPGAQLWDCVEKGRTDYGCKCNSYLPGEFQCPTCTCI